MEILIATTDSHRESVPSPAMYMDSIKEFADATSSTENLGSTEALPRLMIGRLPVLPEYGTRPTEDRLAILPYYAYTARTQHSAGPRQSRI